MSVTILIPSATLPSGTTPIAASAIPDQPGKVVVTLPTSGWPDGVLMQFILEQSQDNGSNWYRLGGFTTQPPFVDEKTGPMSQVRFGVSLDQPLNVNRQVRESITISGGSLPLAAGGTIAIN